jgi:hypothetical protein
MLVAERRDGERGPPGAVLVVTPLARTLVL